MLKENIVFKWVHRFGIDSLNDLFTHDAALGEYQLEEENQEQIKLDLSKNLENIEKTKCESNHLQTSISNEIFNKDQDSYNIKKFPENQKLPLPNIKNLRKWINKDKKAS